AAQTVTVDEAPVVEEPTIGTSLVDAADQDHNLVWNGGTVVDTVTYRNLKPGTEYTVTGELMLKSDGSGTGITGSTTFTPTEANGTVDVEFTVPKGYAGSVLVAFERVFEGTDTTGEPVAVHEDIEDAAQTVTVDTEQKPTTPKPTTPKPTGPKSTDSPLAVTGGALPGIGIGVAGLLLVAGATVLVTRRARSQR
ncbi:hypothetical protein D3248_00630, partial [Leucobacter zeae]|nr:hypothetical protein [Leucobacter zeae]